MYKGKNQKGQISKRSSFLSRCLAYPFVSPSLSLKGSYSPRLLHIIQMAIYHRRINVTREIIKSSRGTRAAISDDAAPALHIKSPYPHRRRLRRHGTRTVRECRGAYKSVPGVCMHIFHIFHDFSRRLVGWRKEWQGKLNRMMLYGNWISKS